MPDTILKPIAAVILFILAVITVRDIAKDLPVWKLTVLARLILAKQFSDLYTRTEYKVPLEGAAGQANNVTLFADVHGHCWADITSVIPLSAAPAEGPHTR